MFSKSFSKDEDLNLTDTPLGDDIADEWPDESEYGQPFRIRTRLKGIKPDIHR